jgi:hypothetical protein
MLWLSLDSTSVHWLPENFTEKPRLSRLYRERGRIWGALDWRRDMQKIFGANYWSLERVAGLLLISALLLPIFLLLVFALRGVLMDVFSQIRGAARNSFVRDVSLSGWIAASLLSLAGLTLLTTILQGKGEGSLSMLALSAMIFATVLLVLEATIHLTFGAWAAEAFARTGEQPQLYAVVFRWASVTLQRVYVPVGYVGLMLYGWAILRTNWLPPWIGWAPVAWGGGMLVFLILSRVTLPATLLVPGVAIGITLLAGT